MLFVSANGINAACPHKTWLSRYLVENAPKDLDGLGCDQAVVGDDGKRALESSHFLSLDGIVLFEPDKNIVLGELYHEIPM